jgi:hypothetical protein
MANLRAIHYHAQMFLFNVPAANTEAVSKRANTHLMAIIAKFNAAPQMLAHPLGYLSRLRH